ncbi:MAG: bifunctional transaldolase/phosoglucose isomerase [bacterium]|nr:bifunctional transaldolase/phosoglucose isomerase [bacterium]MDT8396785.1 bifunctional transaldolase/phosoglucose isomerase [bacterium]
MNNIHKARVLGQSIWIDHIRRSFITSGEMGRFIDLGVTGMTSNPTIFEKAITGSSDYDRALSALVGTGLSPELAYDAITVEDVGMAADLLRPVYERTGGGDGYVSLDVDPHLASDTEGTVSEAVRLFNRLARPNIMIKVPATTEGILAVEELTRQGVNVNVTLIFSLQQYRDAAQAYIVGLKKRSAEGRSINTLASVASFFLSRVDSAVDELLQEKGTDELRGRTAIANARLAYADFLGLFAGHDWEQLSYLGGRVQRPLWASTGTKNPAYIDTMYVDHLIGPHTVSALPVDTLQAFLDHGTAAFTLGEDISEAKQHMAAIARHGIDIEAVTDKLLVTGVEAFALSFSSLMTGIRHKVDDLRAGRSVFNWETGPYREKIQSTLEGIRDNRIMDRIRDHDHTVWKESPEEISNRLGWLSSPENMQGVIPRIMDMVSHVRAAGYTDALLLGMGGSSLAPDLLRRTFGITPGFLDVRILDSTDPGAVIEHTRRLDPARTLFIVSTKSGTTTETLSFFKYFYNWTCDALGAFSAGEHFIAITDPGSSLAGLAGQLGFRDIFLNDPNIGGRYSALSYFGLVPAALLGIDIARLLCRAATMVCNCEPSNCPVDGDNSGAILGAILGTLHGENVDKLTFITSPSLTAMGAWLEQLIAESTGKEGKGILPVEGEIPGSPEVYGRDRLFAYLYLDGDTTFHEAFDSLIESGHPVVRIELSNLYDLGGEFIRWEMATAVAGHVMGINPFDQPNVEAAKIKARAMLDAYLKTGRLPSPEADLDNGNIQVFTDTGASDLSEAVTGFLAQAGEGDYVAVQAFLHPTAHAALALGELRHSIRDRLKTATTVGFGPRFLHSTGQLHKGDRGNGLFMQITSWSPRDLPIPDEAGKEPSAITFGVLKAAQAMGDRQALLDAGRRVIRFHVRGDVVEGIRRLKEAVS